MAGLRSLVLMSLELRELPSEVGALIGLEQIFLNGNFLKTLPKAVGRLPALQDLCLDANQLEVLPLLASAKLKMLTAPGNMLRKPPQFASPPERLELHGNLLHELPEGSGWGRLRSLKAMGNRLRSLPPDLAMGLQRIEYLNLADNCIVALPEQLSSLRSLEFLFLYNNRLTTLPHGLLLGTRLKRLLVEGNALSHDALVEVVGDALDSDIQTLAIDDEQVATLLADDGAFTSTLGVLPPCVSVGSLLRVQGSKRSDGLYLKLARASQLRRAPGVPIAGAPGGPPLCAAAPADVLVVAFAASQGEPEWLGILRSLAEGNSASKALASYPEPLGALSDFLGDQIDARDCSRFAAMWGPDDVGRVSMSPACLGTGGGQMDGSWRLEDSDKILDFDVLVACDGRMRWYAEDAAEVERALQSVCARYRRRLFIGASMGGYGALLHGARLADTVIAFGPQVLLNQAILRPPAADIPHLESHASRVQAAVTTARGRGARVEVHCAADTHLEHALALPLADLALTVHPLLPRTPFARLMERGGVLWPVVASALVRLRASAETQQPLGALPAAHADLGRSPPRIAVARWGEERCLRYWATREAVMHYFFGDGAPKLPRPGDWFCTQCHARNMKSQFFCNTCGGKFGTPDDWSRVPNVADAGVCRVADAGAYPRRGDWGCGVCGTAMQGRDHRCYNCNTRWDDRRHFVVR